MHLNSKVHLAGEEMEEEEDSSFIRICNHHTRCTFPSSLVPTLTLERDNIVFTQSMVALGLSVLLNTRQEESERREGEEGRLFCRAQQWAIKSESRRFLSSPLVSFHWIRNSFLV